MFVCFQCTQKACKNDYVKIYLGAGIHSEQNTFFVPRSAPISRLRKLIANHFLVQNKDSIVIMFKGLELFDNLSIWDYQIEMSDLHISVFLKLE